MEKKIYCRCNPFFIQKRSFVQNYCENCGKLIKPGTGLVEEIFGIKS